jgi:hypothetical protein
VSEVITKYILDFRRRFHSLQSSEIRDHDDENVIKSEQYAAGANIEIGC